MSPTEQKTGIPAAAVSVGPATYVPRDLLLMAMEQSPKAFAVMDAHGVIEYVNAAFEVLTGYTAEEAVRQNIRILVAQGDEQSFARTVLRTVGAGRVWEGSFICRGKDGSLREENLTVWPLRDDARHLACLMSAHRRVGEEIGLDAQWCDTENLQAIGELAAGLADELSAPSAYIGDNISFLETSFKGMARLLSAYRELWPHDGGPKDAAARLAEVERVAGEVGVGFLIREFPAAISQTRDGVSQVADIVRALRDFVHPDTEGMSAIDINRAITSAVAVARNEWRYVANLRTTLDPDLPPLSGPPGAFNHAILNVILDAARAVEALLGKDPPNKGAITIETRKDGEWAVIRVSDTGTGIPQSGRARVCGPFFTAVPLSNRPGSGLAAVHAVIVEELHGSLELETEPGKGTTLTIRLPLIPQVEA